MKYTYMGDIGLLLRYSQNLRVYFNGCDVYQMRFCVYNEGTKESEVTNMNIIAENIARRRKELNMTQRELADKLHVSDKTVSRWETGKQIPDALMMPELAKSLDMGIDELYGINRSEEEIPAREPIQEGKVTLFKLSVLIAAFVYFFLNFGACLPFGTILLIMLCVGMGIALFVIATVFRGFYRTKSNADYYGFEHFRWLGLGVMFVDFVIAIWVPLIKNHLNYSIMPLLWILFVTIVNVLLFILSMWYRNYLQREGMNIQRSALWLPIAVGVLGIVVVVSCKLFQLRNFQPMVVVVERNMLTNKLRLFELGAGISFVIMQSINYVLLFRTWKKKQANAKVLRAIACALAICSIVSVGWQVKKETQSSLYNELAKHAVQEGVKNVSVDSVSVGMNFGVGQDVYTYFTLEEPEHIEKFFDLFHKIKVKKGDPEEEKQGKSCRIRFDYQLYEEGKVDTLSWDVTMMENGEMWYRGETYCISNVDWNKLGRLAISEYDGVNEELYEGLLD